MINEAEFDSCPCGSAQDYARCCGRFIDDGESPVEAEHLMRARYTAHTRCKLDFIVATSHPSVRDDIDLQATENWAKQCQWLKLEILAVEQLDDEASVEFIAHYRSQAKAAQHHEVAYFEKEDACWYYSQALAPAIKQVRREGEKPGRNQPCPCGSGKKYKKCHGAR